MVSEAISEHLLSKIFRKVGAERRTRGREMLPTLAVGWRASAARGDEAGRSSWRVYRRSGQSAFRVDTFNYTDSRVAQINLLGPTPLPPTQTAACLRIQNLFGRINPSYLPTPLVLMLKLSWEASKQLVWIVVTGDNSCRKQKFGLVPFRLLLFRLLPFSPTYYTARCHFAYSCKMFTST